MEKKKIKADILRLLQNNARMGNQEIADRLRISCEEVGSLIQSLEKDGTIMGYSALVNEENLEIAKVRAIIEVEVQPQRDGGFDYVAKLISKFSEVTTVHLVSGRYDLRLEVVGDSLQDVAAFVASKLAPLDGVKATVTHFLLKKYKEAGFRLHKDEQHERLKVVP